MSTFLECRAVSKRIGQLSILNSIDLTVNQGELFFLLGSSGCGKTTLLRLIAGLDRPDSGLIQVAGQDIVNVPPEKRNIGMVFQNYALWPHFNVYQHIEFGLKAQNSKHIPKKIADMLDLTQLSDLAERFPHQLSGGQQQRLSLARALALEPKLLLLDEPMSNLDPRLREQMRQELKRIQKLLGLTFIYVTHDRAEAMAIGDRAAILKDGCIQQVGQPLEIYLNPRNQFAAEFFGDANIIQGRVVEGGEKKLLSSCLGTIVLDKSAAHGGYSGEVRFCVRPEDLELVDSSDGAAVKAKILEIIPAAGQARVVLAIDDVHVLSAAVPIRQAADFKVGSLIGVVCAKDRFCFLE